MAAENDLLAGIDLSALSSVTQAQLMQMVAQAAPLSTRGLIIYMSGAAAAVPDVAGNTRFRRYIWLDSQTDPPTPKIYNVGTGTWDSLVLADGSVTNAKVNAAAAIAITKLAFGTARYIVRTNAAGTALEFVNPNSIFTTNDVGLSALDSTGAPAGKSYLQRNASSGITSFQAIAFADFAAGDLLGVSRIQASGTNNQALATMAGVVGWQYIQDIILDGTLPISKLVDSTAMGATAAYKVFRRNSTNSANEWGTLAINEELALEDSANFDANFPDGAATLRNLSFSTMAAVRPKILQVVARCMTTDAAVGYNAGEEIPLNQIYHILVGDDSGMPAFGWCALDDAVRIIAKNCAAGTRQVLRRDTGALAAITIANWRVKIYVYA